MLYSDTFELTKPIYYTIRSLLNNEYRNEGPASDEIEVNPADFVPLRPEGLQAIFAGDKVVISWKESPETWVKKNTGFTGKQMRKKDLNCRRTRDPCIHRQRKNRHKTCL